MFINKKRYRDLTVTLLIAGLIVGFYSLRYMKEIVSDQFNQQQLELATHAARQLENKFSNIIQDLKTLNQSPSVQYLEKVSWANRIKITLSTMQETGVLEIGRVSVSGKSLFAVTDKQEIRMVSVSEAAGTLFFGPKDSKIKTGYP